MVLLIDTNIILDVLLSRPEFVKDSSMIWKGKKFVDRAFCPCFIYNS